MTKKKILMISIDFPPKVGGISSYAYNIYDALNKSFEIEVLTNKNFISDLKNVHSVIDIDAKPIKTSFQLLKFRKPDIILCTDFDLSTLIAFYLGFFWQKKIINVAHGLDLGGWPNQFTITSRVYKKLISKIQLTYCNSIFTKNKLNSIFPQLKTKILYPTVKNFPVGDSDLSPLIESRLNGMEYILSVGRLVSRKNFNTLIDAFSILNNKNILLVIVGTGPEKNNLKSIIEQKKLNRRVLILNYVDKNDLVHLYKNCLFFTLIPLSNNFDYEGFGIVYLEALWNNKLVIASNTGGIVEIVKEGENGFLVDPTNTKEIVEKLTLAFNQNKRKQLELNTRSSIHKFEFSYFMDTLIKDLNEQTKK